MPTRDATTQDSRGIRPEPGLSAALRLSALVLGVLVIAALLPIHPILTRYYLLRQDLPVVALLFAVFAIMAWRSRSGIEPRTMAAGNLGARLPLLVASGLLAVCVIGHDAVLWGYAFSRDEQMALFDAEIFRHGELIARLPAEWSGLHRSLNTLFMLKGAVGTAWVSIYGPVNAILHALVGSVADPAWTSPLLTAAGMLATWRVAVRLLPDDRESQTVAVLLYATSTQVMALGMTSYAMSAHLAFNMIWLALFLHDRWYAHIGALTVGVLAVGLHQVVYHPLFAGPVLFFGLVARRRWGWSFVYASAYAAAIWFWARYAVIPLGTLDLRAGAAEGDSFILTRMLWALRAISPEYAWIQASNLVRFIAWQNLILLPLFIVGARQAFGRRDWRLVALVAAIAVLIAVKLVLRPYQGHGWGYRYLHGIVGIACILAAVGWSELRRRGAIQKRHLLFATAASLLVATPWLLWQAHQFSGLFARPDRAIAATDADVVIVEDGAVEFSQDLVLNPPYLDRRPIRLLASRLSAGDMERLCPGRTIAFIDGPALAPIAEEFGRGLDPRGNRNPVLRQAALKAGCQLRELGAIYSD